MSGNGRNSDYTAVNVGGQDTSPTRSANDPKIERLQEHVDEVQQIMSQNIDKIMQRGQNLDYLEDRSEVLSSNANEFRVGARRISRKMWWQNMKINIIIGVVILAIIIIIIVSATSSK
ncbi:PREDICTED: vesicle-associated membrane protein 8-like [Rhagoletis zephyria]|uniref:vesicle-associated membrane protein 8-like n=1 Tax=Rhagoletis zephyria TaxID=28612 RepID=UPI0008119C35|nr:PREDICTED: vesicle-associated membrane protein 8-like [Rhagoletis zephyria]KAH9390990.1 Vesicle-associated membrane protein 4 [Tyrophagus putrescentiae]